jgi:pectin methylesterase-like acyl-CoA thioesterase
MKTTIKCLFCLAMLLAGSAAQTSAQVKETNPADYPQAGDTVVVARDGTGRFRTVSEAIESLRAFMDYQVTIYIKKGVYKEKLVLPSWLQNVTIVGEDVASTVITFDDHANINHMGTFRTFTFKIEGSNITVKNLTIENNAAQLGQAVALHTEGDNLQFIGCRFLGNQDTVYTGRRGTTLHFTNCYIEGTTDFIFGPSTALFLNCEIRSKRDSYVTAASTPKEQNIGYVFCRCHLTADPGVTRCYLGRPWRPYAATVYIDCQMERHILPAGWDNWKNTANETTARYAEYGSTGPGANPSQRVPWSRQLTKKEANKYLELFNAQ